MREIVKVGTITTDDEGFKNYISDSFDLSGLFFYNIIVLNNKEKPEYIINIFKYAVDNGNRRYIPSEGELEDMVKKYIDKNLVVQPCTKEVKDNNESEDESDSIDTPVNEEPNPEVNQKYKSYIPKPYCKCSKCGKIFNNSQDLKDDCIFVTESDTYEVYTCPVCGAQIRVGKNKNE